MPAVHLPIQNNAQAHVEGQAEQLSGFLVGPNDPSMVARIGHETQKWRDEKTLVLTGERYRNRAGWVQGMRYLKMDDAGAPVAVLNLTRMCQDGKVATIASNVYVREDQRRKGLARSLLLAAMEDFPKLVADSSLSQAGAALIGVGPAPVRKPRGP